ncbi:hypothetical protein AAK967_08485 [Atopobiaceae bacterium 24-176]
MAIEINKPAPLKIGGRYHYTLSSYDPVTITVTVPTVTDTDIEFALESVAREHGATGADVNDAWVAANLEGLSTVDELKSALRSQLDHMNSHYAEESKAPLCASELAKRLNQQVPMDEIARYRDQLQQAMRYDAIQQGVDPDQYFAQMGIDQAALDAMFDDRAAQTAGEQAALSAYAAEKKLKVADEEIAGLLGLSPADGEKVIEQARGMGQLEDLRANALNMKAANVVVSECTCTYAHETPAQAEARSEQYETMLEMMRAQDSAKSDDKDADKGDAPDLKLV